MTAEGSVFCAFLPGEPVGRPVAAECVGHGPSYLLKIINTALTVYLRDLFARVQAISCPTFSAHSVVNPDGLVPRMCGDHPCHGRARAHVRGTNVSSIFILHSSSIAMRVGLFVTQKACGCSFASWET